MNAPRPSVSTLGASDKCAGGLAFHHEALFYAGGDQGFLDRTLAVVLRAVEDGAQVLVAVGPRRARALEDALGERAGDVRFADIQRVGLNPARIIPLWHEFMLAPGTGLRLGIGEPVWPGRRPAELAECELHEGLLNLAFEGGPRWRLLCPYDLDGLDDSVIESARRTHPFVSGDDGAQRDGSYAGDPQPFVGSLPPPAAAIVRELAFGSDDLAELRLYLSAWAVQQSLSIEESEELVLALNELATNSIRYGGGRGIMRVWRDGETLLCEVRDDGQIDAPLVGRIRPRADARSGRGMWIVNQLSDLLQIRSSPAGTVVRIHKRLG